MPEFTTWSDLETQLLNDLADGAWRRTQSYTLAGRSVTYRSFLEFQQILAMVKKEAALERGGFAGRTYAANGGRSSC